MLLIYQVSNFFTVAYLFTNILFSVLLFISYTTGYLCAAELSIEISLT